MARSAQGFLKQLWQRVEEQLGGAGPSGGHQPAGPADPAPVVWLLGQAGAGKTSIVAALTGDERALVGDGFRPATRTARFYDVPQEAPLLRFLDTRGLGEAGYDPAEDIAWCEGHAHALLCVVRVSDRAPAPVIAAASAIRRRHPDWPVIVVQTALHEFYPAGADHPDTYPYRGDAADLRHHAVPASLAEALGAQREAFADLGKGAPPRFVPVDLTRPGDGFLPADFGADALAAALVEAGASAAAELRHAARMDPLRRQARMRILAGATSALVAGALPVPAAAIPAVAGTLAGMLGALARLYGVALTPALFRDLIGTVGGGAAVYGLGIRFGVGELLKFVPAFGTLLGAGLNGIGSFALAYALGEAACVYFAYVSRGQTPPDEAVRRAFVTALADGLRRARDVRRGSGMKGGRAP